MKLKYCTMTGADDSVSAVSLGVISQTFPFVEWGILLSESQMGHSRFPSTSWMELLLPYADNLNLSGHLCGRWLRGLMMGDTDFIKEIPLWDQFKRIQLNFHGIKHASNSKGVEALRKIGQSGKEILIQVDNVNHFFPDLLYAGIGGYPFFDLSHGAGVLPDEWPATLTENFEDFLEPKDRPVPNVNPHIFRGYAGGLGPDNLKEQLKKIGKSVGDDLVWVDMETKIRSNNDQQFDLDKVRTCLEIARDYVLGVGHE